MSSPAVSLLRRPTVETRVGLRRACIYKRISLGLFPKPVRIAGRNVAWPDTEIDEYQRAIIAGASDAELRELVERMHAARNRAVAA